MIQKLFIVIGFAFGLFLLPKVVFAVDCAQSSQTSSGCTCVSPLVTITTSSANVNGGQPTEWCVPVCQSGAIPWSSSGTILWCACRNSDGLHVDSTGACVALTNLPNGSSCTAASQCQSGYCGPSGFGTLSCGPNPGTSNGGNNSGGLNPGSGWNGGTTGGASADGLGVTNATFNSLNSTIFPSGIGNFSTPRGIISALLPYLFTLGGLVLFVMLIWGGFEMLSGAANPKSQEAGKQRMTAAVIGFLLLFASYWFAQLLQIIFGISVL